MRVLSISGSNIASLGTFVVDLDREPLRSAGVFAIVGPTGSGKSSLLDALCLALYHEVPRLSGAGARGIAFESALGEATLGDARHVIRRGAATAHAEAEFLASDGLRYRAHWGYRAPKRRGAHSQEDIYLLDLRSGQLLANRKQECAQRIQALVGLDFAQFTRTVLLAQGQFAAFLKANDTDERPQILERLTGTEIYTRIGRAIADRRRAEDERLRTLVSQRETLTLLDDVVRAQVEVRRSDCLRDLAAASVSVELVRQLQTIVERRRTAENVFQRITGPLAELRQRLTELGPRLTAAQDEAERARAEWHSLQPELDRAIALDSQLAALGQELESRRVMLRTKRDVLAEREQVLAGERARLDNGRRELVERETWLAAHAHLAPRASERAFVKEQLDIYLGALRAQPSRKLELDRERQQLPALATSLAVLGEQAARFTGELDGVDVARLAALDDELQLRAEQLRLGAEIADHAARFVSAERDATAVEPLLREAALRHERARHAHRIGAEVTEGAVERLRAGLVAGESCPVCGATDHPYRSKTEDALREQVRRLKDELDRAERDLRELVGQRDEARHRMEESVRRRQAAEQRAAAIAVEYEAALACSDLEQLQTLRQRHRSWGEAHRALKEAQLAQEKARGELRGLADRIERLAHELAQLEEASDNAAEKLAPLWPIADWQPRLEQQGEAFAERELAALVEYAGNEADAHSLRHEVEKLGVSVEALVRDGDAARREVAEVETDVAGRRAKLEGARQQRGELLEGRPVEGLRARHQQLLEDRTRAVTDLDAALRAAETDETRLSTQLTGAEADLRETALLLAEHGPPCARALELLRLGILPGPADFARARPEDLLPWLEVGRRALDARREALQKEVGALDEKLRLDDAHRVLGAELAQRLADQQVIAGRFGQLHELVGTRDGKAFRQLAQQYTLEMLLVHANLRLGEITPRYTLEKLGDSMHIVVVDHDNYDTARPVHTLSGGESFVVSLALALALSTLVSGGQAIETLFIDEGFGSLDGDTLRHVMKALDALHAQGQQVGLVTHVEEMKERIPVRVEVRRVGPGLSEVCVVP
ncbi:MAG: AAA family ATPase [Polyangiaceae bacterium]|nr:AAA family ATPase [Polyangiaceae bacterium]